VRIDDVFGTTRARHAPRWCWPSSAQTPRGRSRRMRSERSSVRRRSSAARVTWKCSRRHYARL